MSAEENKALFRRVLDMINTGDLDKADELIAGDYVYHAPGSPEMRGPQGFKQLISMYRTAFPDMRLTLEEFVAEGDRAAWRSTMRGTHTGELLGIGPTGKQGTMTGIVISRLASNAIAEEWENFDQLGLLQQLGVMPRP
jgi:steroid delta-isomerase-like uncharacterized protein